MTIAYLVLYVLAISAVAYWLSLRNSKEDFIIAGRNRPTYQVMLSKTAASVGVGFFLVYTAYTYQYGWPVMLLLIFFAISYFVFAYWAVPQIYKYAKEQSFVTMGDYVAHRYTKPNVGVLVDLLVVLVSFVWLLGGFIGGIKVVAHFVEITYVGALLVTLVLVGGYLLLSGFRVVIITDIIQVGIMVALFGLLIVSLGNTTSITEILVTAAEPAPIGLMAGIAIFGFFSIFNSPDRFQLIYSARSLDAARRGTAWGIVPFAAMFVPLLIVGLYMRSVNASLDADTVFLLFLEQFGNPAFLSFASVMLVAGLMSTADTWIYAIASHLRNGLSRIRDKTAALEVHSLRIMVIAVVVALGVCAFFFRDLVATSILGAVLMVITSVPMFYTFLNGKYYERFVLSVLGGVVGAAVGVVSIGIEPSALMFPFLGSVVTLLIPISFTKRITSLLRF